MRWLLGVLGAMVLMGTSMLTIRAQSAAIGDAIPAVVRIRGCDVSGCNQALGSGVVIDPSGIILTALHVTLRDPNDLNSQRLTEFVIELTGDETRPPTAQYRARTAATSPVDDFALLEIYGDEQLSRRFDAATLDLPWLDLATDTVLRIGETLHFLGYPTVGGSRISYEQSVLSGYDADDVIRVTGSLGQGHSGGPALVERDGRFLVAGVVQRGRARDLGTATLIRTVASLPGLIWTPAARRAWVEDARIEFGPSEAGPLLQLSAGVAGLDLAGRAIDLFAYGFDAATKAPWTGAALGLAPSASNQLVLAGTVTLDGFSAGKAPLVLEAPVADLGTEPERLAFRLLLWDRENEQVLWQDTRWYLPQAAETLVAQLPVATIPPTATPRPTGTPTPVPTATPALPTLAATPIPPSISPASIPAEATDGAFTLSGRGEPGATLEVLAGGVAIGTTIIDGAGYWSLDVMLGEPGRYRVGVRALVAGESVLSLDDAAFIVVPSPTPTMTATATPTQTPIPPSIAPLESETVAVDEPVRFRGQAEPSSLVKILIDGEPSGTTVARADGAWSYTLRFSAAGTVTVDAQSTLDGATTGAPVTVLVAAPTSTPTPTLTPTATPSEPAAGTVREFAGIPFVYVPAGEFTMGSDTGQSDEQPVHKVYLDGYWIMQTEVTNAQYTSCVEAGACRQPDNDRWNDADYAQHPVTDISWSDAVTLAGWLATQSGREIRLPTEAEWEKAARGTDGRVYPWGNDWDARRLNYCDINCEFDDWKDKSADDGYARTAPVGSYPDGASPYGALDMAGNVWEWAADCYNESYYAESPERNPTGPDCDNPRVLRGGSWRYLSANVRAANRNWRVPDYRYDYLGVRLASPGF